MNFLNTMLDEEGVSVGEAARSVAGTVVEVVELVA